MLSQINYMRNPIPPQTSEQTALHLFATAQNYEAKESTDICLCNQEPKFTDRTKFLPVIAEVLEDRQLYPVEAGDKRGYVPLDRSYKYDGLNSSM